jgi:TonB family protein
LLPPALNHQVELHLVDCALCADVVEGLALSEAGKHEAAEKELNRRIAARFQNKKPLQVYHSNWRVAAAVVLLICTSVLVLYYNYREITQPKQGIAADTEKAIQEAMDLGEKSDAAAPEKLADAVPDTVRQTIAANTPTLSRPRRRMPAAPPVILQDEESESKSEMDLETVEAVPSMTESVAAAPPAQKAESADAIANQQKSSFAPESTAVARALQGRVAGVAKQQTSSVASVSTNSLRGQVISEEGQPLPGVTVTVKGSKTSVTTDPQGNFTLTLPTEKATLAFRFLGYETKEKAVTATSGPVIVDLQVDKKSLSEVVVTGHGKTTPEPSVMVAAKPGIGMRAYRKYLEENIRYTPDSPKGRVVVQATVSPTGVLQNLQVIKSLCPSCDEEALRLIQQGPAWTPATQNGSPMAQDVKIVVRFNPDKRK